MAVIFFEFFLCEDPLHATKSDVFSRQIRRLKTVSELRGLKRTDICVNLMSLTISLSFFKL